MSSTLTFLFHTANINFVHEMLCVGLESVKDVGAPEGGPCLRKGLPSCQHDLYNLFSRMVKMEKEEEMRYLVCACVLGIFLTCSISLYSVNTGSASFLSA